MKKFKNRIENRYKPGDVIETDDPAAATRPHGYFFESRTQQQKCLSGEHEKTMPEYVLLGTTAVIEGETERTSTPIIGWICRHCRSLYVEKA